MKSNISPILQFVILSQYLHHFSSALGRNWNGMCANVRLIVDRGHVTCKKCV